MPFDLLEYARGKIKEYYFEKKATRNFSVGYRTGAVSEDVFGTVAYIRLCEQEIHSDKDLLNLMTFIHVEPEDLVPFYDVKNKSFRDTDDVIRDVLASDAYVMAEARVLKRINDETLLIRILDDLLLCVDPELVGEYTTKVNPHIRLYRRGKDRGLIPLNPSNSESVAEALSVVL